MGSRAPSLDCASRREGVEERNLQREAGLAGEVAHGEDGARQPDGSWG